MVEVVDGGAVVATVRIDGDVPGLFLVDAVARLTLAARRLGWRLAVADPELRELLALAGVDVEPGRQPERREEAFVDVVVQPDDPPA
ncbi:MAG TPA: hypothetical protein VF519_15840 [Mycobacteriales bacterium]